MIYDPNDPRQLMSYYDLAEQAKALGRTIEAKFHSDRRTKAQNDFYHLILRYYATEIGLSETEAEAEFKVNCEANREKFVYEVTDKKGNTHLRIRSSADLSKDEMTSAIHNFIDYAAIYAGVIIPYETDFGHIQEAKKETEKAKSYI